MLAIQMTIVKRPFVLDFASAHLDRRPDFDEEIWDNWEEDIREKFENRWPTVKKSSLRLKNMGFICSMFRRAT